VDDGAEIAGIFELEMTAAAQIEGAPRRSRRKNPVL
jgi:hypothetical protein